MSKELSAKYQNNIERLKKARERYQSLSKEEKEKKQQCGCVQLKKKNYQKTKNKSWLSIEQKI